MAYVYYNPNPRKRAVGDCSVRAVSKALDVSWDTAFAHTSSAGFLLKNMPDRGEVWGSVLRKHGFKREIIPNTCPDCYTAENFCQDHPKGTFVLVCYMHLMTVKDGDIYDSWDSSEEVPQYYWYKEEE